VLLPFVQVELPGSLGLPDGRYLARDQDEAERVLILRTLGAPRRGRRRRPHRVAPSGAQEVAVTRATVAGGRQFPDRRTADSWLDSVAGDPERRGAEVRGAIRVLNRALHALRAAALDPLVQDVGATRALAVRIGYGSGEELADGRWAEARELASPRRRRLDDVESQTRVAAVLARREEVSPVETLLLRARLDLEAGREREAALELPPVVESLLAAPGPSPRGADPEREDLQRLRAAVGEAAATALSGELPAELAQAVREAVEAARALLEAGRDEGASPGA
jgi:hypothetical protein